MFFPGFVQEGRQITVRPEKANLQFQIREHIFVLNT